MATERRAPIQGDRRRPAGTIPWDVHLRVWERYDAKFHNGQSAEVIAARGGFGYTEAQSLLANSRGVFYRPELVPEWPDLEGWAPK